MKFDVSSYVRFFSNDPETNQSPNVGQFLVKTSPHFGFMELQTSKGITP